MADPTLFEDAAPAAESRTASKFAAALQRLIEARPVGKPLHQGRVLDLAIQLLKMPGGLYVLLEHAPRFDQAGLFQGSDWAKPDRLQPRFARQSLCGAARFVALEVLSELRFLSLAKGESQHPQVTADQAGEFLAEVLALNVDLLFERPTEASRETVSELQEGARAVLRFLASEVKPHRVFASVVDEAEAILRQRPISVGDVKSMLTHLSLARRAGTTLPNGYDARAGTLTAALFEPSPLSQGDPGLAAYEAALSRSTPAQLREEALACARAMHTTGLVSDYHATLLRYGHLADPELTTLIAGLSEVGRQSYLCYRELIDTLIDRAIFPGTAQTVLGLYGLLERGVLFHPPVAPSLWRQIRLPLAEPVRTHLMTIYGIEIPPEAQLLSGVVRVLGQPLGVGQGDNPTCQAARAITLLAQTDPDYLLQLLCWAARDEEIIMVLEGHAISSRGLKPGLAATLDGTLDPVSQVLVPHLDRIYAEMMRRAQGRGEDPHKWINPAYHGWWVGHECRSAIDARSGKAGDLERFVRHFYAAYHPFYNGSHPVLHPQPAGIAATNVHGVHFGWHAISIQRVTLSPSGEMRVYFHDPNNEGRQQWGRDVATSTEGNGEIPGESSLSVRDFASRLYLFHYDPLELGDLSAVPADEVRQAVSMAEQSWAASLK